MSSLSSVNTSNENNSNSSSSISSVIDIDDNVNLKEHEIVLNDDDIDKNNGENNSSYNANNSLSYLSSSKRRKPSWVWSNFRRPVDKHAEHVFCLLCQEDVFYTRTRSAGMLERHVKRKHSNLFKQALRTGAKKVPKIDVSQSQLSMEGFIAPCPTFEQCLLKWAVATYQPLRCCEERTFRDLCLSLNKRCPILSRDKLHMMVQFQYVAVQEKVKKF
jgi:hypothetical protein